MVENDTKLHKPQIEWPLHSPELNKKRLKHKTAKGKRTLRTVITKCLVKVFLITQKLEAQDIPLETLFKRFLV